VMSRQQIEAIGEVYARIDKPFAVVLRTASLIEAEELASGLSEQCRKAGLPVYPSVQRAARAMSHVLAYQQNHAARPG
jgi:acyl-CoA synthetase (NDP forming)